MTNKQEFFYNPARSGVLEGRERLVSDARGLVDTVESISQNQAVILEEPLIPSGYRYAQNFLKRGPEVYVSTPRNKEEALEFKLGPGRRRVKAFEGVRPDDARCGYSWRGMKDERKRKVHLVDCLEGAKLFAFSHQSGRLEDKIEIKPYVDVRDVKETGGTYVCKVPSRSRDIKYKFMLSSGPLLGTNEQYHVWTNLDSSGHGGGIEGRTTCGSKLYDELTFRSRAGEIVFCPHEIAAYLKISEEAGSKNGRIMLQPFALPSPLTVEFYNRLRRQAAIKERRKSLKTGREYTVTRPLNEAEIEILLWRFVGKHGYYDTFFAGEKRHGLRIKDYDWV